VFEGGTTPKIHPKKKKKKKNKQNSPHWSNFLFISLAEAARVLPTIQKPQMHQPGSL